MADATLTPPLFLTLHHLTTNPTLTQHLVNLCNEAFSRSQLRDPVKWIYPKARFADTQQLLTEFAASDGTMAVILDEAEHGPEETVQIEGLSSEGGMARGKLIACAGVVPWKGGWQSKDPGEERGWEVKTVCVDKGEKYAKKGSANKLVAALEEFVVNRERERLTASFQHGGVDKGGKHVVDLWIITAECVNGEYWRKRGFGEVRRQTCSGIWGCKTSFEMLTLRREVEFVLE
ncbi:hypothetical protein N0V90_004644 [Kalmusia sp. IMI 367209]|nr:hypothetical protein N0V90_004644 [Kalmusia sp. IMI 367209]